MEIRTDHGDIEGLRVPQEVQDKNRAHWSRRRLPAVP